LWRLRQLELTYTVAGSEIVGEYFQCGLGKKSENLIFEIQFNSI